MAATNETPPVSNNPESAGRSKILTWGKYFLLAIIIAVQGVLAFSYVNKNFEDIYLTIYGSLPDYTDYYPLSDIVVNPANTNGQRFAVVGMSLEVKHTNDIPLIQQRELQVRERLSTIIAGKSVAQLTSLEEREAMRLELTRAINETIGTDSVRNLYFTKYIMQ